LEHARNVREAQGAYVKARYSKHYRITEEELTWLGAQVEELGRVVHQVCSERIAELEKAVATPT
jgi:predicted transcriptional regulator